MNPTPEQLNAAFEAMRKLADDSGYGGYMSDDMCRQFSAEIASAVLNPPKETSDA